MYKFTFKIFSIVLALFLVNNSALALDAEFKNSLMKIEVIKTADSNYNLDLYTKNKFVEPIKIIKKSDLNYYVLLPETKNESTRTITQGTEIRSVSTNVYPYAGQDVNNGYVKININTTRPINFKVNIRNSVAAATITPKVAQNILPKEEIETIEKKEEIKTEKKNSDFLISKKNNVEKKIFAQKPVQQIQQNEQQITIEDAVQKEVERVREETFQEVEEELANLEQNFLSDLNEIEKIAKDKKKKHCLCTGFKDKLENKLAQYGVELPNLLSLFLIFVFSFIFMLILLTKKDKKQLCIKRKSELNDSLNSTSKEEESEESLKNDGQFFIFDKNIKQTGFCDPATSAIKRNYELSSYEPELRSKYNRNLSFKKSDANEYDIIQKILKEDSMIDLPNGSFEQQVITGQLKTNKTFKKITSEKKPPIQVAKPEIKKEEVEQNVEPVVLSSVEIAPQRGFMLVSYNDNINLVGYIFDDVYALYNFKQPKLEKYDIKYRLSEKDEKTARFIVKVADVKMLIAVNKSSMALEVIL